MARTYKLTGIRRIGNRFMSFLARRGMGPKQTVILTVRGRKSGKAYSTPVSLVQADGQRWLVAPYGEVSWVKNARAAGEVTLTRGKTVETVRVAEVEPDARGPILKQYVQMEPIVRPYFDASVDAPIEEFSAEAGRHPVFLIQ